MRRKLTLGLIIVILTSVATISFVSAENWPQWRGPLLNGISNEKNLPVKWSTEENITWKHELPSWSGSTPIVWGDYIFLNTSGSTQSRHSVAGDLNLLCLNRNNGGLLWKKPLGNGDVVRQKQNMSSPSPVTDGKRVWVLTGTGIL
ncbi:MAG: pyrrolo-quinoline quinone, partial [Blastocatellia bacterium]|nr:pyrrolo-quinoline quinone [Blastocatellia bacterium]